jgi:uroporphyrinogen decarboxylase
MHHNALPTAEVPPFSDPGEMRHLVVPNPFTDGRMPVYLEALECLRSAVGDNLAIRGTGTGPFSLAAYLLGIDNFLLRLMDIECGESSDDAVRCMRDLLELMTETTLRFVAAQADAGADILYVGDSLASLNMISPRLYRTWVQPYHRKIFTALKEQIGQKAQYTMIHMCGRNMEILEDMVQTGVDLIEIDSAMDLAEVSAVVRGRAAIIGNIDPVHVLKEGGPEEVTRACRDAVEKGIDGGRFILGSGCFVCPGTPLGNLKAMIDCAHGRQR